MIQAHRKPGEAPGKRGAILLRHSNNHPSHGPSGKQMLIFDKDTSWDPVAPWKKRPVVIQSVRTQRVQWFWLVYLLGVPAMSRPQIVEGFVSLT